jgi:hypothetical protein
MAAEVQIIKIACVGVVSGLGLYYAKNSADKYLELKALSAMPESYWATKQKEAEVTLKTAEIKEAAENKRHQETLKYKREKDEKDRVHQLEVMEKEKSYPESYWIYKTEKVKTETNAKTVAKKEDASVERQKTLLNAVGKGLDVVARRYL